MENETYPFPCTYRMFCSVNNKYITIGVFVLYKIEEFHTEHSSKQKHIVCKITSSATTIHKMTTQKHIWLRDEVKENERRTALTPEAAKQLIDAGFKVTVERSTVRIFPDEEYAKVGCEFVDSNSWIENAPSAISDANTLVLGLKELPTPSQVVPVTSDKSVTCPFEIAHRHIFFAHCYKNQANWKDSIRRFSEGKGEILDLEFLNFDNGRRVAAFGFAAGYAGCAIALLVWARQQLALKNGTEMNIGKLNPYESKEDLVRDITQALQDVGRTPKILVIGALGRCGKGSVDLAQSVGVTGDNLLQWDLAETQRGGPFAELLDVDILVNDIYLMGKIPPFLTRQMIDDADKEGKRKLSVFVDVSCDVGNPNNPLPLIDNCTSFDSPSHRIIQATGSVQPLDVIAIDHLPSLTPKESSIDFVSQLVEHLINLKDVDFTQTVEESVDNSTGTESQRVWTRARALFNKKVAESQQ
jgi:saccharopine dehydrogenase (NAD+, L-lysine-forming)